MLEKLITDLKKSLPEALRKKMGGAEKVSLQSNGADEDDNVGFNQFAPKMKKKTVNLVATPSLSSSALEEDAAKKRNSMIVKVIIILGLTYFFVDEILLKEEPITTVQEVKPRKKKAVAPPVETPVAEAATTPVVDPLAETSTPVAAEASTEVAPTSETPPIENINIIENTATAEAPAPAPTVTEAPPEEIISQTRIGESSMDSKIDQMVNTVDQNNPVEEIKIPSQVAPTATDVPPPTPTNTDMSSMASKISEDVIETAPPAYDQVGRGLVYNCKDKHWACLSKPAYLECNKNMQWNASKKNQPSCVVQEIYSSDEDCAKIQKYNVTTLKPTPFCSN